MLRSDRRYGLVLVLGLRSRSRAREQQAPMTLEIEPVLEKYGVEYRGDRRGNQQVRCPFHDDRRASASVNLDEGVFNCFTCSVGGDAIELLMSQEGLTFGEAKRIAEELAGESGREVSRGSRRDDSLLPRRSGHRPGRRQWVSPWSRNRP